MDSSSIKKVGGYKSGWDFRQTYARVYDPRGFEFEITMENLLWILECCNSIKGKGLEGEFVYGYSNGDLLLVPVDSPDYQKYISQSKAIQDGLFVKGSELVVGKTYKNRQNREYVYLGRYNYYKKEVNHMQKEFCGSFYHPKYKDVGWEHPLDDTWQTDISYNPKSYRFRFKDMGKYYWFAESCISYNGNKYWDIISCKNISKRFIKSNLDYQNEYSMLYEKMTKLESFSPIEYLDSKLIYIPFDVFERQCKKIQDNNDNNHLSVSNYNDDFGIEHIYINYDKNKSVFSRNAKKI